MTLPALVLHWTQCPDGVEIVDIPPTSSEGHIGVIYPIRGGRFFRFKSSRRVEFSLTNDFQNPVIVRFINAKTENALVGFFGRFGLRDRGDRTLVEDEIEQRSVFSDILEEAVSGDPGRTGPAVAHLLERIRFKSEFDYLGDAQSARMALRAECLGDFMATEIALLAIAGVRLVRCEDCGDVFLTGPQTERRSSAKFCKDLCRQRNLRKRKKAENNHVSS